MFRDSLSEHFWWFTEVVKAIKGVFLCVCDHTCRCSKRTGCRCSACTIRSETSDTLWQQSHCSQKGPCVWVVPCSTSMLGMLKKKNRSSSFFFIINIIKLFSFQPLSQYCTKWSRSHHSMQLTVEAGVHFLRSSLVFISLCTIQMHHTQSMNALDRQWWLHYRNLRLNHVHLTLWHCWNVAQPVVM